MSTEINVDKVERDKDAMRGGISALLGKSQPLVRPVKEKCEHVSDGFVYNKDQEGAAFMELRCLNCNTHYRMTHTGLIID